MLHIQITLPGGRFKWKEVCMSAQLHETQWDKLVSDIYTYMTEAWIEEAACALSIILSIQKCNVKQN